MKKLATLLLTITLVFGVTQCSSSDSKSSEKNSGSTNGASIRASLANAYENVIDAKSFRIKGTITMTGTISGTDIDSTSTFEGVSSSDSKNSSSTIDMTDFFKDSYEELLSGDKFIVEQRTVDGILYVKMPEFGFGSYWREYGNIDGLTPDTKSQNPAQYLDYLKSLSKEARTAGKEKVDGVNTTHYKAIVDNDAMEKQAEAVLKKNSSLSEDEIEDALEMYDDAKIPLDIWVDEDNLVRKIKISLITDTVYGSELEDDDSIKIESEFVISDFGVSVNVDTPPADQIRKPESIVPED